MHMISMNKTRYRHTSMHSVSKLKKIAKLFYHFLSGMVMVCAFSPFHFSSSAIIGLALLAVSLSTAPHIKSAGLIGFLFGLGFFTGGVSWVYISIHTYGNLHPLLALFISALFIIFLAIYPSLFAMAYFFLNKKPHQWTSCFLFAALWCLQEFARSKILGGFPWLLISFGQMDSPLKYLLPIVGVYGLGLFTAFAGALLSLSIKKSSFSNSSHPRAIIAFVLLILSPLIIKNIQWTQIEEKPLKVAVIQANLSMRNKWNIDFFWKILHHYQSKINELMINNELIILPESAIPVPDDDLSEILDELDRKTKKAGTALIFGIPKHLTLIEEPTYYNSIMALGSAKGSYFKQKLVPFGEFTPPFLADLYHYLNLPFNNLMPGPKQENPITMGSYSIASLICYELAYPDLLRQQLPKGAWIVSVSDDGWFGDSLAMHQQLQMSQALSLMTGRYQVVANNDGLSAIINNVGDLIKVLPAFQAATLEDILYPASGETPWVLWGDLPIALISAMILLICAYQNLGRKRKSQSFKDHLLIY